MFSGIIIRSSFPASLFHHLTEKWKGRAEILEFSKNEESLGKSSCFQHLFILSSSFCDNGPGSRRTGILEFSKNEASFRKSSFFPSRFHHLFIFFLYLAIKRRGSGGRERWNFRKMRRAPGTFHFFVFIIIFHRLATEEGER